MSDFKIVSLLNPVQLLSASGILGASAGSQVLTTGTIVFADSNGIAFGLSNGTLTASVVGGVGGGAAISAGTNSQSSGTVSFVDSQGITFGMNTDGKITATVKTDYQTSGAYLTTARASTDAVGLNTALTANGVSWTVNSSGISLNVPAFLTTAQPPGAYLTTARASTDAVGLNTAKTNVTWTVNSSGISFDAAGYAGTGFTSTSTAGVDVKATNNTAGLSMAVPAFLTTAQPVGAYLTTAAQSNQVVNSINGSTGVFSFNTGSSLSSSRNGNSITWGLASDITSALQSAGAYLTTAALSTQTLGFSLSGNVATTNSSRISNGAYALAGGNGVTIQQSNNTVSISVATNYQSQGAYLTTARASTDAVGLNTAKTNVTWTVNSSGLSLDAGGYAGTVTGATGASITVNSSGVSINLPAYLTTADPVANSSKYVQNWKLTGNTAGTTSSAVGTDLWFSGGNGVTVSGSSGSLVFSVATNYQSQGAYLTTARASTDAIGLNTAKTNVTWTVNSSGISFDAGGYNGTGFTSTTTAGVDIKATNNTSGLSMAVPAFLTTAQPVGAYLTTARASTDAIGLNTAKTNVTWTVNSSGLSLDAGGYAGTGTSATNASVTLNSAGLAISVAAPGAAAENNWINLLGANTAGNTTASGSTIGWSGGNGVTLSGANNSQVVISVANQTAQQFSPPWAFSGKATNTSLGNSTVYFQPFDLPYFLSASRINFYLSLSGAMSAGNSTGTASAGIGYGIYTLGTGADSRTLSLLTSYSLQIYSVSFTSNTVFLATHYAGLSNATSHTTVQTVISNANATTYQATNLNGPRVIAMPLGVTMTPGRYYLGMSVQTVTGNALTNNLSVMATSVGIQPAVYQLGSASSASNASVFGPQQGWGFYSAQTGGFPNTIPFTTDAIRRAAAAQTLVPFDILGYATSSNII